MTTFGESYEELVQLHRIACGVNLTSGSHRAPPLTVHLVEGGQFIVDHAGGLDGGGETVEQAMEVLVGRARAQLKSAADAYEAKARGIRAMLTSEPTP